MYKFRNVSTKEDFEKHIEWTGTTIRPINGPDKMKRTLNINNRFGNEWNLVCSGNIDEWSIYNICHGSWDIPFRVDFISNGRDIEILRAEKAGKHYKADRYLKQFVELVLMANGFIYFGF